MPLPNILHRKPASCWVPPGRPAEVMGRTLTGGMLYLGLGTTNGGMTAVVGKGPEPSILDIALPIDWDNPSTVFRWTPDIQGYFAVGARVKAHYLEWLEGGRQSPDVSTGCLMLFLFGLERRVLFDARTDPDVAGEIPAIFDEVQRLLDLHGERHAEFAGFASGFLEFLRARMDSRPQDAMAIEPENYHALPSESRPLPWEIREALGWIAIRGEAVSPDMAYAWFIQDPTFAHRSAVQHCPQQHKRLFYQRYAEVFRDGLEPDGVYPKIGVRYVPASPSFGTGFVAEQFLELPNLPARVEHVADIRAISDYCEARLAGFARFAAANPDRPQSLETLSHLPIELWPPRWRRPFENLAEEATKGRNLPVLTFSQLVNLLPKPANVTPDIALYRSTLQSWGLAIETGEADSVEESKLVLYPIPSGISGERAIKGEFELANIAYRLLLFVVKTDNAAPHNEYVVVRDKLHLWVELTELERARLGANLAWLLANPRNMLEGAMIRLQNLAPKPKARVVEFLLNVAEALGVEGLTLARMLARTNNKTPITQNGTRRRNHIEPVAVRAPTRKRDAFAIPPNPEPVVALEPEPPPRPIIELDMSRIARLKEESEEVGVMLGAIFTGEPEVETKLPARVPAESVAPAAEAANAPVANPQEQVSAAPASNGVKSVLGLDAKHSRLARQLCEKPSWSRDEALALCASLGLLLDGAIERINEASFDAHDDPLVEGDDVLEINSDIATEIL
jgi:hypothetical protein